MHRSPRRMLGRVAALALPLALGACSLLFAISDDAASGGGEVDGGDPDAAGPHVEAGASSGDAARDGDAALSCPPAKAGPEV